MELVYPGTMCTRSGPDPVPESQLFSAEVEDSEREASDEARERESDRDSAVGSTQGSDTSDSLIRPGDKDDVLGDLFFPGEKYVPFRLFPSLESDSSSQNLPSVNMWLGYSRLLF